ncbi:hypothetical protein [Aquabacterium sp. OR-4]|uniref:hypothetical protein n=1 Tax=Aquabacterium sp. OR-4 TaxID=2978127 RepID=UPI0021B24AA6|nr:hypothetical protein [Aquabacterium sp. OR-4]MDT7838390.1 hypothetical protein [Aquabacterium sp. OR-4]
MSTPGNPTPITRQARVAGAVKYRLGDGPMCKVPPGPVEVTLAATDATLTWAVDEGRQSAAVPLHEYQRMLRDRAIVLDA